MQIKCLLIRLRPDGLINIPFQSGKHKFWNFGNRPRAQRNIMFDKVSVRYSWGRRNQETWNIYIITWQPDKWSNSGQIPLKSPSAESRVQRPRDEAESRNSQRQLKWISTNDLQHEMRRKINLSQLYISN